MLQVGVLFSSGEAFVVAAPIDRAMKSFAGMRCTTTLVRNLNLQAELFLQESPPYERPKRHPKPETDPTEKWPSESSGIYTGSIQSREESTADLDLKKSEAAMASGRTSAQHRLGLPKFFIRR